MTGNDEVDDNPSPWASDVSPPVAAPIEFVFTTSSNDDAALPGSDGHRESSNAAIERPPRRWRAIVAAAVAVALAGIAGAVWLGSNSQGDDTPPDSVSVDIDDLPALPSVDGATDGVATVTPTTSLPIAFPDPFEDFNDFNDGNLDLDPQYSATVAWWTSGTVDVPEPLNTTASMTLVVRTERNLTEVDLPSGATRSFALLRGSSFDEIVVGRTATFVPGEGSPGSGADPPWLLIPGEPPALIEAGNDSLTVWDRPGTDRFSAVAFDFALEAAVSLDVGLDGSSTSTPLDLDDGQALASLGSFAPNGNDLFVDGGGIYERTSDGVTIRIAQGELLASSSHHILIRSCDDNYLCSGQLIDYRDGARSEVQLDPSYASAFSGAPAQISPDGRYLLAPGATFRGTATLLDLQTGEIQDLNDVEFEPTETTATNHVWAADSSGYFRLSGQQVEFYDVSSGQSTLLPQLGDVASYGVRLDLTGVPEPPSIEEARTGLRVRGADRVGTMYDLDLDTGEVTTYEAPEDTTLHYAPRLIIGVGSEPTLLASERGPGTLQLIDGATSSIRLDIDLTSAVLPGPAGSGWRQRR